MAKREVFKTFTFEKQRQEINLLADDVGDKDLLDTLSTEGNESVVKAINEVIDTPVDDVFIDEISASDDQEQKMLFADQTAFTDTGSYDKAAGTNPEGLDYSRIKYDAGNGIDLDRFTYNAGNKVLRVNNTKTDLKNRKDDTTSPAAPGETILSPGLDFISPTQSETAKYTGRLRTKGTRISPIEVQQRILKLQEDAKMTLAQDTKLELATGIDVGAYANITNNKKILYVSANDENASDLPENDGSNINRPFKSIERALLEASKRSFVGGGEGIEEPDPGIDLFENFSIILFPGEYIIDNRPGTSDGTSKGTPFTARDISEETKSRAGEAYESSASVANELYKFNPPEGGLIVPRGTSIVGLDLRKTLIRPLYVPDPQDDEIKSTALFRLTGACYIWQFTIKDTPSAFGSHHKVTAFEYANYDQLEDYYKKIDKYSREDDNNNNSATSRRFDAQNLLLDNKKFIAQLAVARTELDNAGFDAVIGDVIGAGPETRGESCVDDTVNLIEIIAYNMLYGGNDRTYDAADIYATGTFEGQVVDLAGEEAFSIEVFNNARDIMNLVVNNVDVLSTSTYANTFTDPNLDLVLDLSNLTQKFDLTITPDQRVQVVTFGTNPDGTYAPGDTITFNTAGGPKTATLNDIESISPFRFNVTLSEDYDLEIGDSLEDGATDPLITLVEFNEDSNNEYSCEDVRSSITTLWTIITTVINDLTTTAPAGDDSTNIVNRSLGITRTIAGGTEEDYNQRIEENRIVGFVQNKYLSDTVASASPYVFNISLRSVWGMCGLLADGARSTGLRSMVLAQFTGISLQRDDRAFLLNGTTTTQIENPDERHSDSAAEYRETWRHFHIKARNNSFLQIVSVFAVGHADHFVTETGADYSVTNSNSNFGNRSLLSVSHRSEIFTQDNGGFIVGLVPPRGIDSTAESNINIYNIDYGATLNKFDAVEKAGASAGFKKIYLKVNGEELVKESDVPEFYSINESSGVNEAELIVDDVNYLFGKRRYSDGNPEAIYVRLPKNFTDSELQTFAARLRVNESVSDSNPYDPIAIYQEGIIEIDQQDTNTSNAVPSATEIESSIKGFFPADSTDTTIPGSVAYQFSNIGTGSDSIAGRSFDYFIGSVSGFNNPSAQFKIYTGNNAANYDIAIREAPIKTIAVEGLAAPTLTNKSINAIPSPAGAGERQYTVTSPTYPTTGYVTTPGSNATFEVTRVGRLGGGQIAVTSGFTVTNLTGPYANGSYTYTDPVNGAVFDITVSGQNVIDVTLVSGGTNYDTGDTIVVPDAFLGGNGTAPADVTITVDALENPTSGKYVVKILTVGSSYDVGTTFTIPGSQLGGIDGEPGDPTPGNNLTIHVVANENSGNDYLRQDNFDVVFRDDISVPGTPAFDTARIHVRDVTLPQGVVLETNDLYTFVPQGTNINYAPTSGGFDAEYSLGVDSVNVNNWDNLGQVAVAEVQINQTQFTSIRVKGGSGWSDDPSFNSIRVPGSFFQGVDGNNDLVIQITQVGGADIATKNFNFVDPENPSEATVTNARRKFYGWEFARTIDGEYFGRLAVLVDDERINDRANVYGVPTEFDYDVSGALFDGFTTERTVVASATRQPSSAFRAITSITNPSPDQLLVTVDVGTTNATPFYPGDIVTISQTTGTANINGDFKIVAFNGTNLIGTELLINVPGIGGGNTFSSTGFVTKTIGEVTIPVQVSLGNIVNGTQAQILAIYPNDWEFVDRTGEGDVTIDDQIFTTGWDTSGSGITYDDTFTLNIGAGTTLVPLAESTTITFDVQQIGVSATNPIIEDRPYSSTSLKELDYLPGSSLGIRYSAFDESLSLEENTNLYDGPAVDNVSLSLFRRVTQRVDSDAGGSLDISDNFEFNRNVTTTVYMKRIQDSRSSNGNSELLWRLIVKLPKDGYNNIQLRAPEERFTIHLKDPALQFGDETLEYPFAYDYGQTGIIRTAKIVSGDTRNPNDSITTGVEATITDTQYLKSTRRGGTGAYISYENYDTEGTETLNPEDGTFNIVYNASGEPSSVVIVDGGNSYSIGDRVVIDDGAGGSVTIEVTKAVTKNPRSFYVQKVEPIVEYEYNVRDGYYLLTILDGNVFTEYNPNGDTETDFTNTITYGKQRLIGLEDIDPVDGIASEINNNKQDASDLIEKNRLFIQKEAAGFLKHTYPTLINPSEDRCKRDIGVLLNAFIRDLRLGGNSSTINNAQYYFSAGTQQGIENQLEESVETFRYAKNLAIAAMQNWDTFRIAQNSPGADRLEFLDGISGIVSGMEVYEVSSLPTDAASQASELASSIFKGYVSRDIDYTDTEIQIVDSGGSPISTINSNNNVPYYFKLAAGRGETWTAAGTPAGDAPAVDPSVLQDYDYATGECADIRSALDVLFRIAEEILEAKAVSVSVSADQVTLAEDPFLAAGEPALQTGDTVRIFGAQTDALNGDIITVTNTAGTISYEASSTFNNTFTDNILIYRNDAALQITTATEELEFIEPTRLAYDTEDILLEGLGYSQNINYLFPEVDLDNPKWNPIPSNSQYRKDVGNVIIRDNTLGADNYERISQYSITAESTKGILNSILTGGTGATGYRNRIFTDIDLDTEFGLGGSETIDNAEMVAPYTDAAKNEYGVDKSPVIEFTDQNVPIFTDRCIIFNQSTPISFYRPSIIRASSHTWEYVGFGPGNYSTGLPQFQDITLTQQQTVNSQTVEQGGGFVASSGTNSQGDFFIGNQVIDAKGNQTNTLNFPRVKTSAENRLIDYDNLDSLAANTSTASFNPSSFSSVLTISLQAIQEAQRNSFKASNIESSIFTTGTLKVNNKISISNSVFENENNFPVARQEAFGFTKRAPLNWFNIDSDSQEYLDLANSYIGPVDIRDWANAKSLVPSVPVDWNVDLVGEDFYVESSNVGSVDINETFTKSVNFKYATQISTTDERWYDAVNDTISIPLGTPFDPINSTTINNYAGRAGQIFIEFQQSVKAASIAPTSLWKGVDNTWAGVSQIDGSATTFLQGSKFVVSYYVTGNNEIVYAVNVITN